MTPIQAESLPHILRDVDVIAQAKTGSGKTAAFAIGILKKLALDRRQVQALVLCPTRELADQVAKEIRRIARFGANIKVLTLCGGSPHGPQEESLGHGAHVVVGTPGRIVKHLARGALSLAALQTLVLDEADRMLELGFAESVRRVIRSAPLKRQTLLFSATYPEEIRELSADVQTDAIFVQTVTTESANDIVEHFCPVPPEKKIDAIVRILGHFAPASACVFANTKQQCREITRELAERNLSALAIHGDLEQYERTDVLVRFGNGSCTVLVATDLAARGLDFTALAMVINHEVPFSQDMYMHRIGRTGRAGHAGRAFTLYSERQAFRAEGYRDGVRRFVTIDSLDSPAAAPAPAPNMTLVIEGGKKDKVRPGDILGALTGEAGIAAEQVGKIDIFERQSYVAIARNMIGHALGRMKRCRIKGRKFPVWLLESR